MRATLFYSVLRQTTLFVQDLCIKRLTKTASNTSKNIGLGEDLCYHHFAAANYSFVNLLHSVVKLLLSPDPTRMRVREST
jgi:hypothetical protein